MLKNLIKNINFWLYAARGYSSPTSVLSWLVPFLIGAVDGGNIVNGFLALIGILLAHLGVNLFDDIVDFLSERKNIKSGTNTALNLQKGKCKYIIDEESNFIKTVALAFVFFLVAFLIGVYLTSVCGLFVAKVMLLTAFLCVSYPFLTHIGLGEFIVGIVYAPLLYLGTYYVMTNSFSSQIMFLSISTGLLTIGLLHAHTFMDYDFDMKNNKKTLSVISGSKENAVRAQGVILLLAYLNIIVCAILGLIPKIMLITLLSLPTSVSLYNLLKLHIKNPGYAPERKFWMGPMENWDYIVKNNLQSFMIKFLLARNVMVIFTLLLCFAVIISKYLG